MKKGKIAVEEKAARAIAKLTKHDPSFENGWETIRESILFRAKELHAANRINELLINPIKEATGGSAPAEEIVHRITDNQQVMELLNSISNDKRQQQQDLQLLEGKVDNQQQ